MKTKSYLSEIMTTAWQFVKQTGLSISECLHRAWLNYKLKQAMLTGIIKFYFQKVDGSTREAWGTLSDNHRETAQNDRRAKNKTIQVYFDTEKQEFRCFKKLNLLSIGII